MTNPVRSSDREGFSRLPSDPVGTVSTAFVAGIPLAAFVVLIIGEGIPTHTGVALAAAWATAIASTLQRQWIAAASWALMVPAAIWVVVVMALATPCAPGPTEPLTPTLGCPVETVHVVSAIVGGASCLALLTAIFSGVRFGLFPGDLTPRVYRSALLIAAMLILVLLVANDLLTRTASGH